MCRDVARLSALLRAHNAFFSSIPKAKTAKIGAYLGGVGVCVGVSRWRWVAVP